MKKYLNIFEYFFAFIGLVFTVFLAGFSVYLYLTNLSKTENTTKESFDKILLISFLIISLLTIALFVSGLIRRCKLYHLIESSKYENALGFIYIILTSLFSSIYIAFCGFDLLVCLTYLFELTLSIVYFLLFFDSQKKKASSFIPGNGRQ